MEFTCLQENLSKGLATVYRAVPTKSTLPILSNVLLSTQDGRLKIASTNLETTIITYIGASIEQEGAITVPAKLFREFVSTLSSEQLNASLKKDTLHVVAGGSKSKFNGVDPIDFPELPGFIDEDTPHIKIDPREFSDAISLVTFCVSADESRPIFTGVFMKFDGKTITFVGSDGYRLSEKKVEAQNDIEPFTVVLPAKILNEVARLFSGSASPVKIAINTEDNQVSFESDDTLITSRLLNGDYPAYEAIIPTESTLTVEFDADSLLEAVKLTHVFAKQNDSNFVTIAFDPNGNIEVRSSEEETGQNITSVDAKVTGDAFEVAFNAKFLIDFLTNAKGKTIVLEATQNTKPFLLKSLGDDTFLHVLMPIQVQ